MENIRQTELQDSSPKLPEEYKRILDLKGEFLTLGVDGTYGISGDPFQNDRGE